MSELYPRGAQDLITEYWEKKGGRPSPTKGRGKATKGRKSGASNASAASVEPSEKASASKRSNQRKRKLSEETEDEAPSVSKRKARESTADSVPQAITVDDDDEIGNMQQWMSKKNWESIVKEINTVERDANGELLIYFTLCVSTHEFPFLLLLTKDEVITVAKLWNLPNYAAQDSLRK